jgi:aspartyl/glutamyl-tRNA(Asn/Gln) amidotransferase C subunit
MNKDEVLKLAQLARVDIGEAEAETLSTQFEEILGYVGEVKKATSPQPLPLARGGVDSRAASGGEVNVLREDANPHESGMYTEAILKNAPQREGDYVKVKKIL